MKVELISENLGSPNDVKFCLREIGLITEQEKDVSLF